MEAAAVTLVLFFVVAAVALAAAVMMIAARSAEVGGRALRVCMIAGACAHGLVLATVPGVLQVVVLAGAAVVAVQGIAEEGGAAREQWWWRAGYGGLIVGLGLVLVSTWARQYVWTGRELAPGHDFGSAAAVGAAWVSAYAPALVAGLLVVMVAVIASRRD